MVTNSRSAVSKLFPETQNAYFIHEHLKSSREHIERNCFKFTLNSNYLCNSCVQLSL